MCHGPSATTHWSSLLPFPHPSHKHPQCEAGPKRWKELTHSAHSAIPSPHPMTGGCSALQAACPRQHSQDPRVTGTFVLTSQPGWESPVSLKLGVWRDLNRKVTLEQAVLLKCGWEAALASPTPNQVAVGGQEPVFAQAPRRFWCTLRFEKHELEGQAGELVQTVRQPRERIPSHRTWQ